MTNYDDKYDGAGARDGGLGARVGVEMDTGVRVRTWVRMAGGGYYLQSKSDIVAVHTHCSAACVQMLPVEARDLTYCSGVCIYGARTVAALLMPTG